MDRGEQRRNLTITREKCICDKKSVDNQLIFVIVFAIEFQKPS